MKNPIVKEILLGKTVDEAIEEHFSNLSWEVSSVKYTLPEIIKEIIKIGKSDLKFAVDVGADYCDIILLNADADLKLDHYWDHEANWAMSHEAGHDCRNLNEIVEALYGIKRKKPRPKVTNDQFLNKKGKVCPYCLGNKILVLDGETWNDRDEMGCRNCGEIWDRKYKIVVTGFKRLFP
jgi:hypothetical protein